MDFLKIFYWCFLCFLQLPYRAFTLCLLCIYNLLVEFKKQMTYLGCLTTSGGVFCAYSFWDLANEISKMFFEFFFFKKNSFPTKCFQGIFQRKSSFSICRKLINDKKECDYPSTSLVTLLCSSLATLVSQIFHITIFIILITGSSSLEPPYLYSMLYY